LKRNHLHRLLLLFSRFFCGKWKSHFCFDINYLDNG
jgi:hypothetical protein